MSGAAPWPADRVERRPVAELIPFARNARTHSDAQVAQLAASIREWGWTTPVLVDDAGTLIAGHGRVLAARQLGLDAVPAMVASGWTEAQIAAYRLADNKLGLNSGWDDDLLRGALDDLKALDFDLPTIGFTEAELDQLSAPNTDTESEWQGMPEFEQGDQQSFASITVHFADQAAMDEFSRRIDQQLPAKARYIWFPPVARQDVAGERYVNDAAVSRLHPV